MQEVQKLVGSETIDAERKRNERLAKNTQLKLTSLDKNKTMSGHCLENVTLENKSIEIRDIEKKEPPYTFRAESICASGGIVDLWLDQIKKLNFSFTENELGAISEWASYKADKCKSISIKQITLTLEILFENKTANYDIAKMIKRSIANGYAGA